MIYSKDLSKHKRYIKIILSKLLAKELRYKLKKYEFCKTKIDFLNFFINIIRMKINPTKIKAVKD